MVVQNCRRAEVNNDAVAVDSPAVKSKKRARVDSQALDLDAENLNALLVKTNRIIDTAKSQVENENDELKKGVDVIG